MKNFYLLLTLLFTACLPRLAQAQIPNAGLESWAYDVDTNYNPVGWTTSNSYPLTGVEPVTQLCEGTKAMRVKALSFSGFGIPSLASLTFASHQRPTSLHMCMNATVMPGDEVIVYFYSFYRDISTGGDSVVASPDSCTFKLFASVTGGSYCLPIKYLNNNTPDSINITVIAGKFTQAQVGTLVVIDDLSFGCTTGIDEVNAAAARSCYPNPASSAVILPVALAKGSEVSLKVFDVQGRVMKNSSEFLSAGEHLMNIPLDDFADGAYFYTLQGEAFTLRGKFAVSK